jgi:hypothetical protein
LKLPWMKCQKCNIEMRPIFLKCIEGKLHGWLCEKCTYFDKAIGRERLFKDMEKAI